MLVSYLSMSQIYKEIHRNTKLFRVIQTRTKRWTKIWKRERTTCLGKGQSINYETSLGEGVWSIAERQYISLRA